jgi:hypothetical protein
MPKKTRKEKIIANYRRKLKLLQNQPMTTTQNIEIGMIKKQAISSLKTTTHIEHESTEETNLITSYFKTDLKKSLILIAVIIGLEIFLYFATIKQYLRLF